jgi:hypothetical protein
VAFIKAMEMPFALKNLFYDNIIKIIRESDCLKKWQELMLPVIFLHCLLSTCRSCVTSILLETNVYSRSLIFMGCKCIHSKGLFQTLRSTIMAHYSVNSDYSRSNLELYSCYRSKSFSFYFTL